jgi:hypothetical protein
LNGLLVAWQIQKYLPSKYHSEINHPKSLANLSHGIVFQLSNTFTHPLGISLTVFSHTKVKSFPSRTKSFCKRYAFGLFQVHGFII